MKTAAAFVAGVALASVGAAVLWAWHQSDDERRAVQLTVLHTRIASLQRDLDTAHDHADALQADLDGAARELDATRARLASRRPEAEAPSRAITPPPPAPAATPDEPPAWEATVAGALEREVARRFGRSLSAQETAYLVATLATVRDASRGLDATPVDPTDPASIREHVARREALVAADEAFRNEVGIGVSAFVQGLSADKIEEANPQPARPR